MDVNRIVSELDAEIARLQQIRSALSALNGSFSEQSKRGRPKTAAKGTVAAAPPAKRKRKLTPEGRKRIAEAMKRRWAERRKETGK